MDGYKDTILKVGGLLPNTQYRISLYTDCSNGLGTCHPSHYTDLKRISWWLRQVSQI